MFTYRKSLKPSLENPETISAVNRDHSLEEQVFEVVRMQTGAQEAAHICSLPSDSGAQVLLPPCKGHNSGKLTWLEKALDLIMYASIM